jgi:hypothetical protein
MSEIATDPPVFTVGEPVVVHSPFHAIAAGTVHELRGEAVLVHPTFGRPMHVERIHLTRCASPEEAARTARSFRKGGRRG